MPEKDLVTIAQVTQFLNLIQAIALQVLSHKDDRYRWIQRTLIRFDYVDLKCPEKSAIKLYLMKISGYSRPRLTASFCNTGTVVE